jgi:hypothetical protein
MKIIAIIFLSLSFLFGVIHGAVAPSHDLVVYNKNDDKDNDDSDGNAGEPKQRDHKGRKHRGAE